MILISGAGPVGMSLALMLARAGQPVRLRDTGEADAYRNDPRVLALAAGSTQLLSPLLTIPATDNEPSAITEVHVSQAGSFGGTLITAAELGLPDLGQVVRYRELMAAMRQALSADAVSIDFAVDPHGPLPEHRWHVHAEGRHEAPARIDYGQTALVCEATPDAPPAGRAWERFTANGPLALLPLGRRYAVVCIADTQAAADLAAQDDAAFMATLSRRMAGRVRFTEVSPRGSFRLSLHTRPTLVEGNEVWIGNAAQILHPVSGQGLNLGLRDAAELAHTLLSGNPAPLIRYAGRRRLDRWGSIALTDLFARGFLGRHGPLGQLRGLALQGLDLLPPAKRFLARRLIFGWRGT